jgi:uncharacterized protein (TIGR03435 family)
MDLPFGPMKPTLLIALLAGVAFCQTAAFDSIDVHPSPPTNSANPMMRGGLLRGSRYEVHTATMVDLIGMAYRVESDKILGGPNWLHWDRFEIAAAAPPATSRDDLRLMLQKLLADRFHLVIRNDTRQMPAFALTAGKSKPKMKAATGAGDSGCKDVPQNPDSGPVPYQVISCQGITMKAFADVLYQYGRVGTFGGGNYVSDPVVDQTGLDGAWDFELKWTPRVRLAQAGSDGITLFDALDKQLGLRLEPQKAPLPVLIVESVNQKPTPNDPAVVAKMPPPPPTEFEIATIKLSPPDAKESGRMQNGRLELHSVSLAEIIRIAWNLSDNPEMISGLPKSADSTHYDVIAKVASSAEVNAQEIDYDTLQVMLRGLLAERFGLKTHMEDRPVSAYTMTAGPQPKLKKADPLNRTSCKSGSSSTNPMLNRLITCQNSTLAQFAAALQSMVPGYIKAPIRDATGLDGNYDISVSFSGVNLLPGAQFDPNKNSETADPNGSVTLPEAMQKQLGLKLEMGKRPLPVLVVDHVDDKPADN